MSLLNDEYLPKAEQIKNDKEKFKDEQFPTEYLSISKNKVC